MKKENIDALLAKYWEGESTLEEERQLKNYFASSQVNDAHKTYQHLFTFFEEEAKVTYQGKPENIIKGRKRSVSLPRLAAAAAVILLLGMSIFFYVIKDPILIENDKSWAKYEVQDPEQAKALAVDALAFLSVKLNKGNQNVQSNMRTLNKLPIK